MYNAIIIGAGKVGSSFDSPFSKKILTHAHAYTFHSGFNLLGFIDPNKENLENALSKWGGNGYENIEDAFAQYSSIDVISIASPDQFHFEHLKQLLKLKLKLIFIEKPLVLFPNDLEEIQKLDVQSNNFPQIVVNYSRRFIPEIMVMAERIHKGEFGKFISGRGIYGKGLIHNGSHIIDLLRMFFKSVKAKRLFEKITDWEEASVRAELVIDDGYFILDVYPCTLGTLFEIDLLFEKGRIRFEDGGWVIKIYKPVSSETFSKYKFIKEIETINSSMDSAIYYAVDSIYRRLKDHTPILCSLNDGIEALKICYDLLE
ncbi:MAG: Gfo/Idh/MocA family oxidoreductase [Oligoflexia bacterium]|nr:Gfo/Idh/MocA family oxidoreductase [Oligoflexia bacterium]